MWFYSIYICSEIQPFELAQIAGITPNNFKLQYLPIGRSYIPNINNILPSQAIKQENTIENHSIIKQEDEREFEAIALIIQLEGHLKRLPRSDGNKALMKYGELIKERNNKVNNDFKIFFIKIKRGNKNLDEELGKFKLSPLYVKFINHQKELEERKKQEIERQKASVIKKEGNGDDDNKDLEVSFRTFIDRIKQLDFYEGQMVYEHIANPRLPKYDYKPISEYVHVLNMLKRVMGIEQLYSHQMKAIYQIWQGNNVVVTTYTSRWIFFFSIYLILFLILTYNILLYINIYIYIYINF